MTEVTSISCDPHKYGFAPKGSSVVMFSNKELRVIAELVQFFLRFLHFWIKIQPLNHQTIKPARLNLFLIFQPVFKHHLVQRQCFSPPRPAHVLLPHRLEWRHLCDTHHVPLVAFGQLVLIDFADASWAFTIHIISTKMVEANEKSYPNVTNMFFLLLLLLLSCHILIPFTSNEDRFAAGWAGRCHLGSDEEVLQSKYLGNHCLKRRFFRKKNNRKKLQKSI